MKALVLLCSAALVSSAFGLQAGDPVTPEAVGKAKFVQGEAPVTWEPGKLYFIECWATWCGPCIAAIPHVNDLHKKYYDKGLRVIGLNVWDDDADKTAKFVKNKGEGMSYPVGFVGRGGTFETGWLTPAGVKGIPHTFLVRDGKLLATHHPGQLTDEVIEKLLAGGEGETGALATIAKQKADRAAETVLFKEFRAAQQAKDTAVMAEKIEKLSKFPAAARSLPNLKLDLAQAKGDWPAAKVAVGEMADDVTSLMPLGRFASVLADDRKPLDVPADLSRAVIEKMLKARGDQGGSFDLIPLAALQAKVGDKEGALKTAQILVASPGNTPPGVIRRYAEEVAKGNIPSQSQFYGWLAEERKASAPAK